MADTEVKTAAARQAQSKADKLDMRERLLGKKARTKTLTLVVEGEEDIVLKFQAISSKELDKLRAKHKPTASQRADGLGVNIDTFNPALVAACLIEPEMSEDDIKGMWESDVWSHGELQQIFMAASDVCMEGMDIPSSASA